MKWDTRVYKSIININCVSTALQIKMLVTCLKGQLISIIVVKCYRFQSFKYMFDCSSVIIDMILCLVIFIKKMLVVISLVVNLFSFRLSVFA